MWSDEGAGRGGGGGKGVSFGNKIERTWILDLGGQIRAWTRMTLGFLFEQLVPFPEMVEDWVKTEWSQNDHLKCVRVYHGRGDF